MARKPPAKDTPVRRFAKLILEDGTAYDLCYDFGAIRQVERQTGIKLFNAITDLGDLSADQFVHLLTAAIQPARPEFTVSDADVLLSGGPQRLLLADRAIAAAYRLSMGKPNPPAPAVNQPPKIAGES